MAESRSKMSGGMDRDITILLTPPRRKIGSPLSVSPAVSEVMRSHAQLFGKEPMFSPRKTSPNDSELNSSEIDPCDSISQQGDAETDSVCADNTSHTTESWSSIATNCDNNNNNRQEPSANTNDSVHVDFYATGCFRGSPQPGSDIGHQSEMRASDNSLSPTMSQMMRNPKKSIGSTRRTGTRDRPRAAGNIRTVNLRRGSKKVISSPLLTPLRSELSKMRITSKSKMQQTPTADDVPDIIGIGEDVAKNRHEISPIIQEHLSKKSPQSNRKSKTARNIFTTSVSNTRNQSYGVASSDGSSRKSCKSSGKCICPIVLLDKMSHSHCPKDNSTHVVETSSVVLESQEEDNDVLPDLIPRDFVLSKSAHVQQHVDNSDVESGSKKGETTQRQADQSTLVAQQEHNAEDTVSKQDIKSKENVCHTPVRKKVVLSRSGGGTRILFISENEKDSSYEDIPRPSRGKVTSKKRKIYSSCQSDTSDVENEAASETRPVKEGRFVVPDENDVVVISSTDDEGEELAQDGENGEQEGSGDEDGRDYAPFMLSPSRRSKSTRCLICRKDFANWKTLLVHHRIHRNEYPFSCWTCGRKFRHSGTLTEHEETMHGDITFVCETCHDEFTSRKSLMVHRRKHKNVKPFSCSYCHKTFTLKSTVVTHERQHTGEKPFTCDKCDKSFTDKSNLRRHKLTHLKYEKEHPYHCSLCDRRFKHIETLSNHERSHSEKSINRSQDAPRTRARNRGGKSFSCKYCEKTYVDKRNFDLHIDSHRKPNQVFKCPLCRERFRSSQGLRAHNIDAHGSVKRPHHAHSCHMCERECASRQELRQHLKTHKDTNSKKY